jgi:hypothetical protein
MPAESKNKSSPFIDERTRIALRIKWQALRRHKEYRHAVQTFRQEVTEQFNILSPILSYTELDFDPQRVSTDRANLKRFLRIRNFLKDIDNLSRSLRSRTFPMAFKADISAEMYKSFESTAAVVRSLRRTENRDLFPPLTHFERDWGIRIPLDPAIPFLPDFVALQVFRSDYEVSLTYAPSDEATLSCSPSDVELIVEFRIRPGASKKVLRAQFDTILQMYGSWDVDRKAPRMRQRQEFADYENMFLAYDLHRSGQSIDVIARQLWLKEFERNQRPYPEKNPIALRARDCIRRATKLIRAAKN